MKIEHKRYKINNYRLYLDFTLETMPSAFLQIHIQNSDTLNIIHKYVANITLKLQSITSKMVSKQKYIYSIHTVWFVT